jgi:signal transduction histidine kinase
MNLVMNAIHAMNHPGTIWLRLSSDERASRPSGGDWVIEVEDQGAGIAPENLGKIFEPFFTTKPVGEGTGLGLSIVAGIVREHGGSIEVASVPGQGSTFRVHLPRGPLEHRSMEKGPSEEALT